MLHPTHVVIVNHFQASWDLPALGHAIASRIRKLCFIAPYTDADRSMFPDWRPGKDAVFISEAEFTRKERDGEFDLTHHVLGKKPHFGLHHEDMVTTILRGQVPLLLLRPESYQLLNAQRSSNGEDMITHILPSLPKTPVEVEAMAQELADLINFEMSPSLFDGVPEAVLVRK